MLVNVVQSDYSNPEKIRDVPLSFFNCDNALYIGAREGQVKRVRQQLQLDGRHFVCGSWELGLYGFLNTDGTIDPSVFKKHDIIYAADPARVSEKFRKDYEKLLWALKNL